MATTIRRDCMRCGEPGDLPVVDEAGTMHGYLCPPCDRKRRRRHARWRHPLRVLRRSIQR